MSKVSDIASMRVDRNEIRVFDSFAERDESDRAYWKSLTPEERLTALEMMRQVAYGYTEDQRGLQGFFEVVDRERR
jgi:hypothetical protein